MLNFRKNSSTYQGQKRLFFKRKSKTLNTKRGEYAVYEASIPLYEGDQLKGRFLVSFSIDSATGKPFVLDAKDGTKLIGGRVAYFSSNPKQNASY